MKAINNVSQIWNEGFECFCTSTNESSKRKEHLGMKLHLEKALHSFASLLKKQKAQNYEKWRNSKENSKTHLLFEFPIPG